MSNDKNELKDQLNILFDDIDEDLQPRNEAVKKTSGIVAAEKSPLEDTSELTFIDLSDAENAVSLRQAPEQKPEEVPRAPKPEEPSRMFEEEELVIPEVTEDEESRYVEAPVQPSRNNVPTDDFFLDGDDYEEDAPYDDKQEADETDPFYVSPHREELRIEKRRESMPTAAEMRKESVRFWIFTAVIAVIVAVSVILILNRRGFIDLGFGQTTAPSTKATAAPTSSATAAPSTEKTTEPTTKATTEPTTKATEPSSESSSESSSEPSSEQTTESQTEPVEGPETVIQNYTNLFVIANAPTVNMRQEATTDSAIIGTMDINFGGEVLEVTGDWYHVKSGGLDGYVYKDFVLTGADAQAVAVANAKERVKVLGSVNIRTEPNTDCTVIEVAPEGAVFEYVGTEGDFYKIRYNNAVQTEGYVSKDFASLDYYVCEAQSYYSE